MWETQVRSWVRKIPWRRKWQTTPVFSLSWRIPWTEEPGGLQSRGSQSRTWLSNFHLHYDSVTSIWGEGYSDSPSRALAVLSPPPSSLGWVLYSFYFISLKVTSLQGENGTRICQVSWLWDCNWEMPPSVHLLPEKCVQTDAGGGCKWSHQQDRGGLLFWCMMSQQQVCILSGSASKWFPALVSLQQGTGNPLAWATGDTVSRCFCRERLAILSLWRSLF